MMSSSSSDMDHLIVLTQHILGKTITKELAAEALKKRGNDPHKAIDFILNQFDIEERLSALTNRPSNPSPSSLYPPISSSSSSSSLTTLTPSIPSSYAAALHHSFAHNGIPSSSSSSARLISAANHSQRSAPSSATPSPISSSNNNNNSNSNNNNNSNNNANNSGVNNNSNSSSGDESEGEIEQGKVVRVGRDKNDKLIGFIARNYGQRDLFFHESRVIGHLPEKDDLVEYRVVHNEYSKHENKWNAFDVTIIKAANNNLRQRPLANTPNSTNDDVSSSTRKFGVIASTDFLLINAALPVGVEETKPVYIYSAESIKTETRTVEEGDIVEFNERGPSSDPEAYDIIRATYHEPNKVNNDDFFILHQIVKKDESKDLEFKSFAHASTGSTLVPTCEKYINSFLNSSGGTLLVGVDNDGKINGLTLDRKFRDKFRTGLDGCMQEATPPVDVNLYELDIRSLCQPFTFRRTVDGKSVSRTLYIEHPDRVIIRITVKPRPRHIVAYSTSGRGGTEKIAWIRRDGSTRKMTPTEIAQRAKELERERLTEADVKTMIDNAIKERLPQTHLSDPKFDRSVSSFSSSSSSLPPLHHSDEERLIEMVSNYGFEKELVSACVKTVLRHPNNRIDAEKTDPKRMQFIVSQILDLITQTQPSQSYAYSSLPSSALPISSAPSSSLNHPSEFLDPITKELMSDPYLCSDSYNYNKTTIDLLFASLNPISPITKQPMVKTALPNRSLQEKIQLYIQSIQPPSHSFSSPPSSITPSFAAAPLPPLLSSPQRSAEIDERKLDTPSSKLLKEKEKEKKVGEKKQGKSTDKKEAEKIGDPNPFALLDIPKSQCPLCQKQFPLTELASHASECQGENNEPVRQRMDEPQRSEEKERIDHHATSASTVMDLMNGGEDHLPCEFCDQLVPLSKYSEHAIQCRTRQTSNNNNNNPPR